MLRGGGGEGGGDQDADDDDDDIWSFSSAFLCRGAARAERPHSPAPKLCAVLCSAVPVCLSASLS